VHAEQVSLLGAEGLPAQRVQAARHACLVKKNGDVTSFMKRERLLI
jgi:hypothetical protein